jgi:hypothetical protein
MQQQFLYVFTKNGKEATWKLKPEDTYEALEQKAREAIPAGDEVIGFARSIPEYNAFYKANPYV